MSSEILDLTVAYDKLESLRFEIHKRIVGQEEAIKLVLVVMVAGPSSHVLLESVPGLAKTWLFRTIAQATAMKFSRIQMTPDMLPADVTGAMIYSQKKEDYVLWRGPLHANLVLADEINRAPEKIASAFLQPMEEGEITPQGSLETESLPKPFILFATQNPIEQEGTYELAEAFRDRLLMKIILDYPSHDEAVKIIDVIDKDPASINIDQVMDADDIIAIRKIIREQVYLDESLKHKAAYIVELTRPGGEVTERLGASLMLDKNVTLGGSPRPQGALIKAARPLALFRGREFVTPQDLMDLAPRVLSHRMNFEDHVLPGERNEILDKLLESIFEIVFAGEL